MQSDRVCSTFVLPMLILITAIISFEPANADQSGDLTMADLAGWLDAYGDAWESRDADIAADLFSEDSSYRVTPYEEPHLGPDGVRLYWGGVTENQRNVQFEYQPLSVTGDTGIAHWSAQFDVEPSGAHLELDGIFILEFDENGKCRRLREWWHLRSQDTETED